MSERGKTLKDLATRLEISVATVSRALAGHQRIALATRERVAKAAREIGYVPNSAARALVSGRSGFVGLTLPVGRHGLEDSFLGEFVSGLSAGLGRAGIDLFLAAVPDGKSELAVIRNVVETRRADGLVLARVTEVDPRVDYLIERGFPFVAHGRLLDESRPYPWLDTDGHAAFAEAFELLYGLGHRHFGFVTIDEPMTFRGHRAAGVADAIVRRGDPEVRLDVITAPRFDRAARSAEIRRLLDRSDRPTAVLGLFDGLAIAVLAEAAGLDVRVPDELSVIGFGDTPAAAHTVPGLTTFEARIHESAEAIAAMLAAAIANRAAQPQTRLVRAQLTLRGSHGPAPIRNLKQST